MTEFYTVIPWICLLLVFGGMAMLQWRALSSLFQLAKSLAELLGNTAPKVVTVPTVSTAPPTAVPVAPAPQAVPAAPSGPFADYPAWFQWAVHEIGTHEVSPNTGPALQRYISLAHTGEVGQPWCSIFACAAMESNGVRSPRSPSSQSWRTDPNYVKLDGPAKGAVAVYWRGSQSSGLGHVGFYRGEDATRVWTLGGNENDMVEIAALAKDSASFGLIGYWWPKSVPLPQIGAVQMPAGSASTITTPPAGTAQATLPVSQGGSQTNIIATMFGSQENDNRSTAYGGPLNDNAPGVALPFHFPAPRPRVRVTNAKTGASVDCDVVDVGPWNIKDPYWQTGTRPQAESGMDMGQVSNGPRRTNGAGIDLTSAAASAIGLLGKGYVNWNFIESAPAAPPASPNVV